MANITFYGAAGGVTGSKHLLEINGKKILLDCGFFQGHRKESLKKNREFLFDPSSVDALVLSHAHIDHSGNIPSLVKKGFAGKIHMTKATGDLVEVMLMDSAKIQENDAEYARRRMPKAITPIEPLYTSEDIPAVIDRIVRHSYADPFELFPGISVRFFDAGHVLGSSMILIEFEQDGKKRSLTFTGDLGRKDMPILRDPRSVEYSNILITESTYGNRMHDPITESRPMLQKLINETIRRGGKIVIPAFSLERTQEIIYDLHVLAQDGDIPRIPVIIDSPLAIDITQIFRRHPECFDQQTRIDFDQADPFAFGSLQYTRKVSESKALNHLVGPAIIIAASGMCEGGRIRHHLKNSLPDPKNTIAIVGYMAQHTLGRALVERSKMVRIFDQFIPVRANIEILNNFSAHADASELLEFATSIKGLDKIFVVHGEPDQSQPLAEKLRESIGCEVMVPLEEGHRFEL